MRARAVRCAVGTRRDSCAAGGCVPLHQCTERDVQRRREDVHFFGSRALLLYYLVAIAIEVCYRSYLDLIRNRLAI